MLLQGYCPTSQPEWSAFRQPAFGHGILTFFNETTALWEWNRSAQTFTYGAYTVLLLIPDTTCCCAVSRASLSLPAADINECWTASCTKEQIILVKADVCNGLQE